MAAPKYEYKIVHHSIIVPVDSLEKYLNEICLSDGWRVMHFMQIGEFTLCVLLEREI